MIEGEARMCSLPGSAHVHDTVTGECYRDDAEVAHHEAADRCPYTCLHNGRCRLYGTHEVCETTECPQHGTVRFRGPGVWSAVQRETIERSGQPKMGQGHAST